MTRRIIDSLIEEEITFILVSQNMEECDIITSLLYEHGYPLTIYRADLYTDLSNEVNEIYGFQFYPAIFIKGQFIGGTRSLFRYFSDEQSLSFSED